MNKRGTDRSYAQYIKSGCWKCPGGGAHDWRHRSGENWHCVKCPAEKVIPLILADVTWNRPIRNYQDLGSDVLSRIVA